jgi:hypothetical protein
MKAGIQNAAVPAAAAFTALAAAGIASAKAAADDAESRAKLDGQLRRSAGASEAAVTAAEGWIDATSKSAAVADDELRPALANLVRATGDVTDAQDLMNTALDLSAATGASLESTSKALAKAHEGSYGALKKLVPTIDDAAVKSKDFGAVLGQVQQQVGGASAEAAGTAAGQYKLLGIQMNELQESVGAALLPAFAGLVGILIPLAELAQRHSGLFVAFGAAVASVAGAVLVANAALKIYEAATLGVTAAQKVAAIATKGWAAAQALLNAAWAISPIGVVVVAVIALGAALVLAYRNSQTFRNLVNAAFDAVVSAGRHLAGPVQDFAGALKTAWGYAQNLERIAVAAFNAIWDAIQRVITAIGNLIGRITSIHFPSKPGWLPLSTGFAIPAPMGISPAAVTGEAGGMNVTVTVTGAIDPEATAQQIRRILTRYDRRRGQRPLGGETNHGGAGG